MKETQFFVNMILSMEMIGKKKTDKFPGKVNILAEEKGLLIISCGICLLSVHLGH